MPCTSDGPFQRSSGSPSSDPSEPATNPTGPASPLARVASLDDPTRRGLYDHVVAQRRPVSRDEAAKALEVDRSVAAYHLDKLVDQGLLMASFARPDGRSGPGAGRPAKHYERVDDEVSVSIPARDYRLAAEVLARAAAHDVTGQIRQALDESAATMGRELAAAAVGNDLATVLDEQGYEPFDDDGVLRLGNCPFHRLAREHTDLVCGMNVSLLGAVADTVDPTFVAVLDPSPQHCCVTFVRRPDPT